jgi:hypothetical protein
MSDDDDGAWLETLAGKRADGASQVEREAAEMRRAMLERSTNEDEVARRVADPTRVGRLLDRARREGVTRRPSAGIAWLRSWPAVLAAAAVCVVAIGVGFQRSNNAGRELDGTVRSASHAVVLTAADPRKLRDQIADELDAAGLPAHLYESLGRAGIDADLPDPAPDAVRVVLARHGVPLPADGVLRIEVAGNAP